MKIYGERNTATNYLGKLIALNFQINEVPGVVPAWIMNLQNRLPGKECVRDSYFALTYHKNLGWKHSMAKSLREVRNARLCRTSSVGIITLVKNPYAWLLSLHRKPYHSRVSIGSMLSFVTSTWETIGRDNIGHDCSSPVELWNIKNRSYIELAGAGVVNLTAEALIKDPKRAINNVAKTFGLGLRDEQFRNHDTSTKGCGGDSGSFRDYYGKEVWRKELSPEIVEAVNRRLDLDLVKELGYSVL